MAVTYTVQEDAGILTHKGQNGFVRANLIHDGSTATKQIALASTSSIKTILAVFGGIQAIVRPSAVLSLPPARPSSSPQTPPRCCSRS